MYVYMYMWLLHVAILQSPCGFIMLANLFIVVVYLLQACYSVCVCLNVFLVCYAHDCHVYSCIYMYME